MDSVAIEGIAQWLGARASLNEVPSRISCASAGVDGPTASRRSESTVMSTTRGGGSADGEAAGGEVAASILGSGVEEGACSAHVQLEAVSITRAPIKYEVRIATQRPTSARRFPSPSKTTDPSEIRELAARPQKTKLKDRRSIGDGELERLAPRPWRGSATGKW
ncbi:MAG: hypothetical protein AB8I08_07700 [Sandaracinaceae bacterium]